MSGYVGIQATSSELPSSHQQQAVPTERSGPAPESGQDRLPDGDWAKLRTRYRDNGARWLVYHVLDRAAVRVSWFFARKTRRLEIKADLPGLNSVEYNRLKWTDYDWSEAGDEWSLGEDWRESLIEEIMLANLPADPVSLEIGPGAGRWSGALQEASIRLVLVDITERALELCREKFAGCDNVEYQLTEGASLASVEDESIDFVWSFGVFVHIAPVDQKQYLRELARVMKPGSRAVIQHAGRGGLDGGWRSSMTAELFAELLAENGLRMLRQFDRWGPDGQFTVTTPGDVITLFERAA